MSDKPTYSGLEAPLKFPATIPHKVGGAVFGMVDALGEFFRVLRGTIRYSIWGKRPKGEVLNQMYQVGNKSLLFVCVTLGCLGMVLVYQICLQVNKITGDMSQVGSEFIKGMVHAFVPSLTAMMIATRVGAGIAAEIGSMMVTEQVDALRMSGVEPIEYLIAPRFIATLVMTVFLTIIALAVAVGAGTLMAWASFDVNPVVFFSFEKVTAGDMIIRRGHPRGVGLLRPHHPRRLRGCGLGHHPRGDQQLPGGHRAGLHPLSTGLLLPAVPGPINPQG